VAGDFTARAYSAPSDPYNWWEGFAAPLQKPHFRFRPLETRSAVLAEPLHDKILGMSLILVTRNH